MLSGWGGGEGAAEPSVPSLVAGSARHRPVAAQQEGAPLAGVRLCCAARL